MNHDQINRVLVEFEATMTAIKGIEKKVSKVNGYLRIMKGQREELEQKAKQATGILDNLSKELGFVADEVLDYFTRTLDVFAGLVEQVEMSVVDLGLQDAPRQMQREFGPLLCPALVLVMILTVSNCYFGFLLADDPVLEVRFTAFHKGNSGHADAQGINILKIFAIAHVSLLAAAALYLCFEGGRALTKKKRRSALFGQDNDVEDTSSDGTGSSSAFSTISSRGSSCAASLSQASPATARRRNPGMAMPSRGGSSAPSQRVPSSEARQVPAGLRRTGRIAPVSGMLRRLQNFSSHVIDKKSQVQRQHVEAAAYSQRHVHEEEPPEVDPSEAAPPSCEATLAAEEVDVSYL